MSALELSVTTPGVVSIALLGSFGLLFMALLWVVLWVNSARASLWASAVLAAIAVAAAIWSCASAVAACRDTQRVLEYSYSKQQDQK
jgi:hypothetical protein